jgi:hypothetical protein
MKFSSGDETDTALAAALKHEFLRCMDAFDDFATSAKATIMQGENRRIAFRTYNAYGRFIHHLYEFLLGAAARAAAIARHSAPRWPNNTSAATRSGR